MKVVCQDARTFRLEDHENDASSLTSFSPLSKYPNDDESHIGGADLVTLSYSLSMIVGYQFRTLILVDVS